MQDLSSEFINQLALWDRLLLALSLVIAFLLFLAVFLFFLAVILRLANSVKSKVRTSLEAVWNVVILDVLAGEAPPDNLIDSIKKRHRRHFVEYLLRYARLLRGEEIVLLTNLAKPFLPEIVTWLKSRVPERRAQAIQIISTLGIRDYDSLIVEMLDDPSPLVAMTAARMLARKDRPEHARRVLQKIHRFDNWSSSYLTSMFVAVGPEITPDLRAVFQNGSNPPTVRRIAADALRELNDFPAADIAAEVLRIEENRDLLAAGLRLLARCGRPDHLDAIRSLIESSEDIIRGLAVEALGELGGLEDNARMWRMVFDPSPWVALKAAWALRKSGGRALLEALTRSVHVRSVLARYVLAEKES